MRGLASKFVTKLLVTMSLEAKACTFNEADNIFQRTSDAVFGEEFIEEFDDVVVLLIRHNIYTNTSAQKCRITKNPTTTSPYCL